MARQHRFIGFLAGLLGAAGCTQVGPDFTAPAVEVANEWELYESAALKTTAAATVEWWQVFDDPILNELVIIAPAAARPVAHSPTA